MGRLPLIHALGAALVDDTFGVAQDYVVRPHPHGFQKFYAGNRGRARSIDHKLGLAQRPSGQVTRVDQARCRDDRRAVLIVVEDRDIHEFAQTLLDDEAFRRLDVFQVDPAKAWPEESNRVDKFIDILGPDLEIDTINISKTLEQGDL